jgi:hypothetical protein
MQFMSMNAAWSGICWGIILTNNQGLNCQKISGGLTSAYSLSLSLHTGDSASLTTAGGWNWPLQGIPRQLVWGVEQTSGGLTPQPPAIQTLLIIRKSTNFLKKIKISSLSVCRFISAMRTRRGSIQASCWKTERATETFRKWGNHELFCRNRFLCRFCSWSHWNSIASCPNVFVVMLVVFVHRK